MPEDVFVYLGQCLRDAREECGLTQQELADQTGRGLRHLQDIEKGRKNPALPSRIFPVTRCMYQKTQVL